MTRACTQRVLLTLRSLLLVGLTFLSGSPPVSAGPSAPQPWRVVGVLTEQGDKFCNADDKVEWINLHFQVGWVPLVVDPAMAVKLRGLLGQVVVVSGERRTLYGRPKVTHKGQCPIPQLRSDMVEAKTGIRLRRDTAFKGRGFEALSASSVRKYNGLRGAKGSDGDYVISFRNGLGAPVTNLRLVGHYYGCYGKPGSTVRYSKTVTLKVGEQATHSFLGMENQHGGDYTLSSIQVLGNSSRHWFDLEVGLSDLAGDTTRCRRKGHPRGSLKHGPGAGPVKTATGHLQPHPGGGDLGSRPAIGRAGRGPAGAPLRPRHRWRGVVKLQRPTVKGPIEQLIIQRLMRRRAVQLRSCYRSFLTRTAAKSDTPMPNKKGTRGWLDLRLKIGSKGRVKKVAIRKSKGFGDKVFIACTKGRLMRLTFPKLKRGVTTVVQRVVYTWLAR